MSRILPPRDGLAVTHRSMTYPAAATTCCILARAENSPRMRLGSMIQRPLAVVEQCLVNLGEHSLALSYRAGRNEQLMYLLGSFTSNGPVSRCPQVCEVVEEISI